MLACYPLWIVIHAIGMLGGAWLFHDSVKEEKPRMFWLVVTALNAVGLAWSVTDAVIAWKGL